MSLLQKAIGFITYKKTKNPPSFTLPESNEESGQGQDNAEQQDGSAKSDKETDKQSSDSKSRRKATKKPLSPSALKSSKSESDEVKQDFDSNKKILEQQFHLPVNKDLIIRDFSIGNKQPGFIAYLDGMADKVIINDYILRPLFNETNNEMSKNQRLGPLEDIILTNDTKSLKKVSTTVTEILKGNTALYIDGLDHFITCESIGYDKRGIEPPKTEGIVKGPQEGFSENLRTNISLIRRIVRNKDLITEFHEIGEKSNTTCAIVYLDGVVNPAVVKEVQRRLKNVKTDFLVSSGMLEQLIEDNPYSIVPTILSTERPDRTASHLIEGRAVIIVDGSPFSMIVPVSMHALMHSPEDAALKWQYATSLRFIRFVAVLAAAMLPALYIALTTFHREMIPTDLLIAIAKAKENVPFPTLVEILLMELGFELIREAGLRVPGIIGNTLGIIGALILGEAAVSANIVSPILIIIVAVTGLSSFAIPNYNLAFGVRITRFYFIGAGTLLGFYGISLALVAYVLMLVNLKSFGVPFISIISPRTKGSKDIIIKWPIWMQESRPDYLNSPDRRRQPKITRQWAEQDPNDA
ncbi:MAG: spore gernimation protein GerA [Gracilibacter sp. BRH_c7a]|nr:MAG: spore gernimation protein GerA [Gracilibacter sp. BRH_c7a]